MLVGPSGVGKNEIMKQILKRFSVVNQLATATTRPMRETEQQGREHLFVSLEDFNAMIAKGDLVEYQEVYRGSYYGTPRGTTQAAFDAHRALIADIEVLGAKAIKAAFPGNVVSIFVAPPSLESLERRLRQRGRMDEAEIQRRLERAPFELKYAEECDHRVINPDAAIESAVQEVSEIVLKELTRRQCL
jgi:guanylate kinase